MPVGPITASPVLVTGASGFIGSHIVQQLLEGGYRVRGTVRDPVKARADGHLTSLSGAAERLELTGADLLTPGAFDDAVRDCEYVIHTASPYAINVADPQVDLVDPAVRGTISVLESCRDSHTMRRVVLTSSVAAITDRADGRVYTEREWNTRSSLTRNPYYYSKTLAEQAAWQFMEARRPRFDLVAINPFFVIGPSLVPGINTSHTSLIGLTDGQIPVVLALDWPLVDVRDVARAHILAIEKPAAAGRYIVAAETRTVRQVVDLLRTHGWGARYKLPSIGLDNAVGVALARLAVGFQPSGTRDYMRSHLGGKMRFDNSKARRELGIEFRDVDQTILDTMD
ncbi:MAG TPA: SDR family oxidoreductase, partial [Acidimicrobiia bacterium]|nr:SDR family oxidoreductase [Acidimicrobiia bacterium]